MCVRISLDIDTDGQRPQGFGPEGNTSNMNRFGSPPRNSPRKSRTRLAISTTIPFQSNTKRHATCCKANRSRKTLKYYSNIKNQLGRSLPDWRAYWMPDGSSELVVDADPQDAAAVSVAGADRIISPAICGAVGTANSLPIAFCRESRCVRRSALVQIVV
jgi:hypothetical protein